MILFLQYKARGRRGGEITSLKLFEYFKSRFSGVSPNELSELNKITKHPFRHMIHSYKKVKLAKPRLLVLDVSSGIRNVLATGWVKRHGGKLMVIMLGLRMSFRYNNPLVKFVVRFCELYLLKKSDIVLVNSKFTAQYIADKIGCTRPVIVAYPGVEISPDYHQHDIKKESEIIRLLFVGECTEVKGLIYLIKAMPFLKEYDVHLNIAGNYSVNDNYYKMVSEYIIKNNLQQNVSFLGFLNRSELDNIYRQSSLFVLPSLFEGYGKTLIESLAFGLPIVATRVGAVTEILQEDKNAIFVNPKEPKALADAIKKIIDDDKLRDDMIKANLEKAKAVPTWEDYFRKLDSELKPIIDRMIE